MIDICTNTCAMPAAFRIWDSGVKKQEILGDGYGNARRQGHNKVTQTDPLFNCFGNNALYSSDFYCSVLLLSHFEKYLYLLSLSGTLFSPSGYFTTFLIPNLSWKGFSSSVACPPHFILLSFLLTATKELYVLLIKDEILWKTKLMQLSVPWP